MSDPFAPLSGGTAAGTTKPKDADGWSCVTPIPDDAPPPPEAIGNDRPSARWAYADAAGALMGFSCRFDRPDGSKEFKPLTCWRRDTDGRLRWRWAIWPAPRPVFNLDALATRPKAPVVVVEGEKAADAAARLLVGHVAMTSSGGSKSAGKTDWSPLSGRRVIIWPDADVAGAAYAESVARLAREAGAAFVAVLTPPEGVAEGWDAADAEAEGWNATRAEEFVATAAPSSKVIDLAEARLKKAKPKKATTENESTDGEDPPRRRPRAAEALVSLVENVEFWCDEDDRSFATFQEKGAWKTHRINSSVFSRFISTRTILREGLSPTKNVLEELIRYCEGLASLSGVVKSPALRVAALDGRYYVDLVDENWRVIEIDAEGWRILDRSPVPFLRRQSMRSLPEPEAGFELDILRNFVRFHDEDDFVLFCLWLVSSLLPLGPYPILCFGGEQGVGKSVITELARSLVDPNRVPLRMPPKDDEALFVSAQNSHLLAFDNLSSMPGWLSDALCVISTDGGWGARQKYSDEDEHVMKTCRPIIANGIATLTSRPDFGSRAITIRLDRIPDEERRPIRTFWREWNAVRPRVFATLLDGISAGLARIGSIPQDSMGRLADFEIFSRAAEVGLGFADGAFMAAYRRNRDDLAAATYEADPLANAVRTLVSEYPGGWSGTPSELLFALNTRVPESTQRQRNWPQTVISIGSQIDRIAPVLRTQGIAVERRKSNARTISIARVSPSTSE